MCEICREDYRRALAAQERDERRYVEADDTLPARKSRKGRSRKKWCKGKPGVEHDYQPAAMPNRTWGKSWYHDIGLVCTKCGRQDGWPQLNKKDPVRMVECKQCHAHARKILTPVERNKWPPPVVPGFYLRAPDSCPSCGFGGPDVVRVT